MPPATRLAERVIPLNPDAFDAVPKLREQARAHFGDDLSPDWYVFFWWPATGEPDPTRPALGWSKAWKAAGIGRLPFLDLRHTAITDLAEGVASEQRKYRRPGPPTP